MSNPLQPKCMEVLEKEYKAYAIKIMSASKAGHMDIIACINGLFYGFEVKWKSDQPSLLQKQKINTLIDAGGKGFFIRSIADLRDAVTGKLEPTRYSLGQRFEL